LAGLATAATKPPAGAKACVDSTGDLRLLTGSTCPKGDQPITLGRRGPRGARGQAATPEHEYVRETRAQTPLAIKPNTVTAVIGLRSLPAGSWVFSSETTVVNFGQADYFRCKIVSGRKQIASGTSTVGNPGRASSKPAVPRAASTVASLGLIGTAVEPRRFTAFLACWHDLKTKGPAAYIDPGAVLIAHPTGSISGRTF
jgi:hypothetical protein